MSASVPRLYAVALPAQHAPRARQPTWLPFYAALPVCDCMQISGSIGDKRTGRFGDAFSLPQVCEALIKAAYDPRIKGLYLKIGPVGAGWAKLKEVRDHLRLFRESGKFMIAFSTIAGEKEYYLASACSEIYMPPTGRLQLAGFSLSGTPSNLFVGRHFGMHTIGSPFPHPAPLGALGLQQPPL